MLIAPKKDVFISCAEKPNIQGTSLLSLSSHCYADPNGSGKKRTPAPKKAHERKGNISDQVTLKSFLSFCFNTDIYPCSGCASIEERRVIAKSATQSPFLLNHYLSPEKTPVTKRTQQCKKLVYLRYFNRNRHYVRSSSHNMCAYSGIIGLNAHLNNINMKSDYNYVAICKLMAKISRGINVLTVNLLYNKVIILRRHFSQKIPSGYSQVSTFNLTFLPLVKKDQKPTPIWLDCKVVRNLSLSASAFQKPHKLYLRDSGVSQCQSVARTGLDYSEYAVKIVYIYCMFVLVSKC